MRKNSEDFGVLYCAFFCFDFFCFVLEIFVFPALVEPILKKPSIQTETREQHPIQNAAIPIEKRFVDMYEWLHFLSVYRPNNKATPSIPLDRALPFAV